MDMILKPFPRTLLALTLLGGSLAHAADTLSLTEAMARAVAANPAMLQQQAEVEKQTLEQGVAHGQRLPRVDLNADYTRYAYSTLITPIRAPGVFPPMDRDVANIGLALSLPLYSGGTLVAGEALATDRKSVV